jgi:hypothetical protein
VKSRDLGLLALLAVITGCWWFLAQPHRPGESDAPSPHSGMTSAPVLTPPAPVPLPTPAGDILPSVRTRGIQNPEGGEPIIPSILLETGELPWEATIRKTLADKDAPDAEKGRRLLETIPTMPVEGREVAAEEAIKRIPNAEYRHAQAALANPAMFGTSVSVLFADLMNRPDEIRLPTLLMIARNPEHPYAPNARDNLNLLIGKDLGTDWTGWDAAIRQHLARKQ